MIPAMATPGSDPGAFAVALILLAAALLALLWRWMAKPLTYGQQVRRDQRRWERDVNFATQQRVKEAKR